MKCSLDTLRIRIAVVLLHEENKINLILTQCNLKKADFLQCNCVQGIIVGC
jgi:hypothetical protein